MVNFFDITEVEVPVTYPFLDGVVMRFYLRPILDKEEKAARQTFFAKTDADREKEQHDYTVKMLASLSTKLPENVPGLTRKAYGDEPKAAILRFFEDGNVMKQKLADDVLTIYFGQMQPKEFFRSV